MGLKVYSIQPKLSQELENYSATLKTWQNNSLQLAPNKTHFGFVYQGHPTLFKANGESYHLHPRMYFCLPGSGKIDGLESSGIVISCSQYKGVFSLGGAIEDRGRFAYIDGGTNSLLIPPIMLGDPCLNALYFPSGVNQTMHTHPSYRIGIVAKGECKIETPKTVRTLYSGTIFYLTKDCLHKFCTHTNLTMVIFHPDSDIGFTHQHNPMLKRTLVDGISASNLPLIQTKIE